MYHLPLTLDTPAANLALDEALLDAAVDGELAGEVLRVWEPATSFVVLGRSSPLAEAHHDACRADGVPVLRRASGGAAVVAGPGCLLYAVTLDLERRPELRLVDRAHRFLLGRIAAALAPLLPPPLAVVLAGISDLALADSAAPSAPLRKFSGNSLRLKRGRLLYHGTILYDFPLAGLDRYLAATARTPAYRAGRSHAAFVTNFPASRDALTAALVGAWDADEPLAEWPRRRVAELASARYAAPDW